MTKPFHIALLLLFISNNYFSQNIKFEKTYGGSGYDYGYSVIQTYDNGYIIAGTTTSFGYGNTDAYLIKTDSNGYAQWQKTYGGINIDAAYSVKQTRDSGLVIAGYTNSFGQGGYDMYVIRTDRNGDTLWTKTYGGSNWDFAYSIDTTNDGGFIIAGGTYSYGYGDEDIYLVKTDAQGDTLWTKTYGGIYQDEARSVTQTTDSGYVLTGFTESFGDSLGSIYYIKTNKVGDTIWTKTIGRKGANSGTGIIQKSDGGYALSGNYYDTTLQYIQAYNISTLSTGDTIWTRESGVPNVANANSVCQANDNGIVWAGELNLGGQFDYYVKKVDINGNYVFATTFGTFNGDEDAFCVQQTKDKGYIIVGTTDGAGSGLNDVFLVKTDSNGVSTNSITSGVGIKEIAKEESNIIIYPNPFSDNATVSINLSSSANTSISIEIYDEMGRASIETKNIKASINNKNVTVELDGKEFNSGIYFLQVISQNTIYSKKFIVQH